jgi:hypothetical protein
MVRILVNNKGVALMVVLLVLLFLSILSIGSFSLASDAETSESSTAQTYYDSLINYQQEQASELIKFKERIGHNISGLNKDISRLNSEVKSGQLKYTFNKGSVVLGSLYGSKGKLGLDKSAYSGNPDILSSVTAVTDTKTLGTLASIRQPSTTQPPIVPPSPVCTTQCHQECRQAGYGQVCTQVCTQVCN